MTQGIKAPQGFGPLQCFVSTPPIQPGVDQLLQERRVLAAQAFSFGEYPVGKAVGQEITSIKIDSLGQRTETVGCILALVGIDLRRLEPLDVDCDISGQLNLISCG